MPEGTDKICFIIWASISSVFSNDIVVIYEPLKKYDRFRIIKWTFFIVAFHMSLIKRFVHNRTKSSWRHKMIYRPGWVHSLDFSNSFSWRLCWHGFCDNLIYIGLNMMQFLFEYIICCLDSLVVCLEYDIHCIEKKRNIEYGISHSQDLSRHSHRNKIAKSDCGRCNNSKIKSIEIICSNRKSRFKSMNKECSKKPGY